MTSLEKYDAMVASTAQRRATAEKMMREADALEVAVERELGIVSVGHSDPGAPEWTADALTRRYHTPRDVAVALTAYGREYAGAFI